nr:MAG TPA: hypothetical protein [Caudoviricetes sp.]
MFIDEVGATRHAISDKELNELYKRLENFIADCTIEEAKENRDAINRYNEVIEKYFDKPLTSDSEVEIINC